MKRITALIFTLIVAINYIVAQQNIIIRGVAENGFGRKVELYRIADQISKSEILVDSYRIDENGHFDLRCWTNYPIMVTLKIENYSQSFYVEPGREYETVIPTFDWNLDEKRNVFLDPVALPIVFKNIRSNDINVQIDSIDRVITRFIDNNRMFFDQRFHPTKSYFDSLVATVNRLCPDTSNDFVTRYKTFQLAELCYIMRFDSRKNIYDKYIRNKPILYYDENYMSLFATLYANTISKGNKYFSVQQLANWVYNLNLDTYIDSIGMDPLLRHEQIRELAALQALRESYYIAKYNGEMVIKMIEKLASQTKFPEHKKLADNILNSIRRPIDENKKISFNLPDVDKNIVSLLETDGKWRYIAFVRVGETASLRDLETMAHLRDKTYATGNVEFVTVDCNREFQKMFHFLKNTKHGNRYDWTWLHFDGNYDLLRYFQIYTYPWFVLVSPEGEIVYDVTPGPGTGFLSNGPWMK